MTTFQKRDLALILLCSTLYLLLFLGARHLTIPDEGRYPQAAWQMLQTHNWITPLINGVPFLDKPILYYWLEAASMSILGVNAWAIRLPQMLFGVTGIALTYFFGARFYHRRVGLMAAGILACCPLYFLGTHYADMDLEVGNLLWISALLFLLGLQYEPPSTKRRLLLYSAYAVGALAFLTKGLMGLALPAMAIFIWIALLNKWKTLTEIYLPTGLLLFALIVTPWLVLAQQQNSDFLNYFFYVQQVGRFLGQHHFHSRIGVWFYPVILLIGMLPWSIFFIATIKKGLLTLTRDRMQHPITVYLLVWCCLMLGFFSIPATKLLGYILPIMGPLVILMALTCHQLINKGIDSFQRVCITIGLTVIFCLGLATWIFPFIHTPFQSTRLSLLFAMLGLVCLSGSLLAWRQLSQSRLPSLFITTLITMALFNLITLNAIPIFDVKTSNPLISKVKPLLHKNSTLIAYQFYQQDMPLLLQKNMLIVNAWHDKNTAKYDNWQRELYIGIRQYQAAHQQWPRWYINKKTFRHLWETKKSVFVFINDDDYAAIKNTLAPQATTLARYRHARVIVN